MEFPTGTGTLTGTLPQLPGLCWAGSTTFAVPPFPFSAEGTISVGSNQRILLSAICSLRFPSILFVNQALELDRPGLHLGHRFGDFLFSRDAGLQGFSVHLRCHTPCMNFIKRVKIPVYSCNLLWHDTCSCHLDLGETSPMTLRYAGKGLTRDETWGLLSPSKVGRRS